MYIGKFGAIKLTTEQAEQLYPLLQQIQENGMIMGQLHYDPQGVDLSIYLKVFTPEEAPAMISAWGGNEDLSQLDPYHSAFDKLIAFHGGERDGNSNKN